MDDLTTTHETSAEADSDWQRYCHNYGEKNPKVIEAFRDERTRANPNTFTELTTAARADIEHLVRAELEGLRVRAYLYSDDFIILAKTFRKSEEERSFLRPVIRLDKGDYLNIGWSRLTAKTKVFEEGMTYDPEGRRTRSYRLKMPDGTARRVTIAYRYLRKNNSSGGYPRALFNQEKAEWARDIGWQTEEQFQRLRKENILWRDILRKLDQIKRLQEQEMNTHIAKRDELENSF